MIKMYRFFLILLVSFFITFNFTAIKKAKLENEVEEYFRYLTDTIYTYQINVFNSKLIKGENSKELLIFNKQPIDNKVKDISETIDNFFYMINENSIIKGNLWSVANVYPNYMYIKPYRNECKSKVDERKNIGNQYFNFLLKKENIKRNLERYNLIIYRTMRVEGPFFQCKTNEKLITIYYPLYLERKIDSILLLDIKADFLNDFFRNFNHKNMTNFKLDKTVKIDDFIYNIIAKQKYFEAMKIPIKRSYWFFSLICLVVFTFLSVVYEFILFLRKNINENKKDKLTGFYRKDCFNDNNRIVSCLIIIDIDYFKKINDTYGHQMGDYVLTEVSHRIMATINKSDIGIRWGGEEFVILVDDIVNITRLHLKLNTLLHAISDQKICDIDVTISIGSFLSSSNIILSEAFKYADDALYQSKKTGRNKYTITAY